MKPSKLQLFLILIILVIGALYWKSDFFKQCLSFKKKQPTIFVSVASYRDKQCPRTLEEIYNKADHPENIFVGVYQQNAPYDISCQTSKINPDLQKNIRLQTVSHEEARGPAVARYHVSQLYGGEDFYFQIDSHTFFVPHWDTKLLEMWNQLKDEKGDKSVLTTYAMEWDVKNEELNSEHAKKIPLFCGLDFHQEDDVPWPKVIYYPKSSKFHESPIASGNFLFAPGSFLKDVPYDPNLHYLFFGEEALLGMRLWCKGYRMYNPTENILFHAYDRSYRPTIWEHKKFNKVNSTTLRHVKILLGLVKGKEDATYPFGVDPKCVKEYYKYFKADPLKKTSINLCEPGNILISSEEEAH